MKFAAALRRVERRYSIHYARVNDVGGLTWQQAVLFDALHTHPLANQTDLVTFTGIDRSTLSQMMCCLERGGLIARVRLASDRRTVSTTITRKGGVAHSKSQRAAEKAEASLLLQLNDRERGALLRNIDLLAQARV